MEENLGMVLLFNFLLLETSEECLLQAIGVLQESPAEEQEKDSR